jgi:hypothetical protein
VTKNEMLAAAALAAFLLLMWFAERADQPVR